MPQHRNPIGKNDIALVLALGLVFNLSIVCSAVLWDALNQSTPGMPEGSAQLLLAAFTGIIGLLGAEVGARKRPKDDENDDT